MSIMKEIKQVQLLTHFKLLKLYFVLVTVTVTIYSNFKLIHLIIVKSL